MELAADRFVINVQHTPERVIDAESFATLMTLRGHYVRVYNAAGQTEAMCYGCTSGKAPPDVVCFSFGKVRDFEMSFDIDPGYNSHNMVWTSREKKYLQRGRVIPKIFLAKAQHVPGKKVLTFSSDPLGLDDEIRGADATIPDGVGVAVILKNIDLYIVVKLITLAIPIVCLRDIEVSEYVDQSTGVCIDDITELNAALESARAIQVQLPSRFSPVKIAEEYEKLIRRVVLPDASRPVGHVETFFMVDKPDAMPGFSLKDTVYTNEQLELGNLWMNAETPIRRESLARVVDAFGISSIVTLHATSTADLESLNIRPYIVVFDEPPRHVPSWLRPTQNGLVFISESPTKAIIGFMPELEMFARGLSDLESIGEIVFERFSWRRLHTFRLVLGIGPAKVEGVEWVDVTDRFAIDRQAFPKKFSPKRLETVGVIDKPESISLGKMINGRFESSGDPFEDISRVANKLSLKLRNIPSDELNVTLEKYRGIDVVVDNTDDPTCRIALEAICCGVFVVVKSKRCVLDGAEDVPRYSCPEQLESCLSALPTTDLGEIASRFDMNKLSLDFLK